MSRFPNCSVDGCESVALWQPVFLVWLEGQSNITDEPTRIKVQPKICAICINKIVIDDLLVDAEFEKISNSIIALGRPAPVRSTMRLDWVSLKARS